MKRKSLIKTIQGLKVHGLIHDDMQMGDLQRVNEHFQVSITPAMASLITEGEQDPIGKQFIPNVAELQIEASELNDPIGDNYHQAVAGVVHRYPDRCLLKIVNICPVYCRFCFRKEMIGPGNISLTASELEAAYSYIESQAGIWEVILTGGDPFIMKPNRLGDVIDRLAAIAHVEVIRVHTRVPVVDPERITDSLIARLNTHKALYVVLHANHAKEFSDQAIKACTRLINAGIPMLSQSVLLKGINDQVDILADLMRTLVKLRIKPYYLHHADLAKGTAHFQVSIERGQHLMRELQRRVSGLCMPIYMLEIPGGGGKMPISPCYAHRTDTGDWLIDDHLGISHSYP